MFQRIICALSNRQILKPHIPILMFRSNTSKLIPVIIPYYIATLHHSFNISKSHPSITHYCVYIITAYLSIKTCRSKCRWITECDTSDIFIVSTRLHNKRYNYKQITSKQDQGRTWILIYLLTCLTEDSFHRSIGAADVRMPPGSELSCN